MTIAPVKYAPLSRSEHASVGYATRTGPVTLTNSLGQNPARAVSYTFVLLPIVAINWPFDCQTRTISERVDPDANKIENGTTGVYLRGAISLTIPKTVIRQTITNATREANIVVVCGSD